ncbi:MAG: transposase [Desulfamplus sp.]|nr:transposase [Desulfamplus sp.]
MDPFKNYSCLDNYDIYAGDGHYHAAAVHDPRKDGKRYSVQHFYALNLRNHALKHLIGADVSGGRKKEHDMRALKNLSHKELRQNAPKGRKVIYSWDKACIDFQQWFKWKRSAGIYFISQEKGNMKLHTLGVLDFDRTDDLNTGVLSYEVVGTSCGVSVNRIKYQDPVTGEIYVFITTLSQLPPGLVAYIYKLRWDIEKVFDEIKNKMEEKKAWATSVTAKVMQAVFMCLAHNLMMIMEDNLKTEQGIENTIEFKRKRKRLDKAIAMAKANGVDLPKHLRDIRRFTQRSVKFIRWLRNNIFSMSPWTAAVGSLKLGYADF